MRCRRCGKQRDPNNCWESWYSGYVQLCGDCYEIIQRRKKALRGY